MSIAVPPPAEAPATPAATGEGSQSVTVAAPTPPPTTADRGPVATSTAPDAAPSTPPAGAAAGEVPAAPDAGTEDERYAHLADLPADELIKRHPGLQNHVGRVAQRQAQKKLDAERERLQQEAQQAAERHKQALYERAQRGDAQAELELLDLTKRELGSVYGQRAVAAQLQQAEQAARNAIWQQHAASFGLDPEDDEVAQAVKDAADFKALNKTVLARATDADAIEVMWAHPAIQKRHEAALTKAREEARTAAFMNGQASLGATAPRPDLSTGGGAADPDDELAIARRLAANPHDADALAAWGKRYRKVRTS